jgi:ribosomal protein L37AE/L43A
VAAYNRSASASAAVVMDCAECGAGDGMRRTYDLSDNLERKSGEVWTCTGCGAEYTDQW